MRGAHLHMRPSWTLLAEDLVHHLCALGGRGPDLVAGCRFRRRRWVVSGEQGDALVLTPGIQLRVFDQRLFMDSACWAAGSGAWRWGRGGTRWVRRFEVLAW